MTEMKCDCKERFGVDINSLKLFEEMKQFFCSQVQNGIFIETNPKKPYYKGYSALENKSIEWYPTRCYQCQVCGCIWEFLYPDFPAKGFIRKSE